MLNKFYFYATTLLTYSASSVHMAMIISLIRMIMFDIWSRKALKKRYDVITQEIRDRTEYELGIIFQMGFSGYFLIVWEFIN